MQKLSKRGFWQLAMMTKPYSNMLTNTYMQLCVCVFYTFNNNEKNR